MVGIEREKVKRYGVLGMDGEKVLGEERMENSIFRLS